MSGVTHDRAHCIGQFTSDRTVCPKRETCIRWQLHIDYLQRQFMYSPYAFPYLLAGDCRANDFCSYLTMEEAMNEKNVEEV